MENMPNSLEAFKNWEFSSGVTTGLDFKVFSRLFKRELKRQLSAYGIKLVRFNVGHYYLSGFVEKNNKFAYFSISDVRYFPDAWHSNILIRTAKSASDYTGGSNSYTSLNKLGSELVDC